MNKVWEWYKKRRKDKKEYKLLGQLKLELFGNVGLFSKEPYTYGSKYYWRDVYKEALASCEKNRTEREKKFNKGYLDDWHNEKKENYENAVKECDELWVKFSTLRDKLLGY